MKIRVMTRAGDELLAEVNENTTQDELGWIDQQFQDLKRRGFSPLTRSGTRITTFSPDLKDDILFVAPLVGG